VRNLGPFDIYGGSRNVRARVSELGTMPRQI